MQYEEPYDDELATILAALDEALEATEADGEIDSNTAERLRVFAERVFRRSIEDAADYMVFGPVAFATTGVMSYLTGVHVARPELAKLRVRYAVAIGRRGLQDLGQDIATSMA